MKPWAKAALQGAACGLVFGAVVLAGGRLWRPGAPAQGKEPAVVVKATRFEVVDMAGKMRASLGVGSDGSPILALSDAAGSPRVTLEAAGDETALRLFDGVRTRAILGVSSDGHTHLGLYDGEGRSRAGVALMPDGSPALVLSDAAGGAGQPIRHGGGQPAPPIAGQSWQPEGHRWGGGTDHHQDRRD